MCRVSISLQRLRAAGWNQPEDKEVMLKAVFPNPTAEDHKMDGKIVTTFAKTAVNLRRLENLKHRRLAVFNDTVNSPQLKIKEMIFCLCCSKLCVNPFQLDHDCRKSLCKSLDRPGLALML
jgi:hypothetical protein